MQVVSNGQSADVLKFSAALSARLGTKTGQQYHGNVSQSVLQYSVTGKLAGQGTYSKYKLWRRKIVVLCIYIISTV